MSSFGDFEAVNRRNRSAEGRGYRRGLAEAKRRIIAACGCGTEDGCDGECDGGDYEYGPSGVGCARFVRALKVTT